MTRHTKKWKGTQLEQLSKLAKEYPIVAIASLENFPAPLFNRLRKKLSGMAVVRVSKVRIIQKALKESRKELEPLQPHISKNVAVIFTKMNPFELFSFLKKNKGSMLAKEGQIAPEDIVVTARDTGLPPGPALSDLKNAGLKVKIQGPTIQITDDSVVAKKGAAITKPVAGALAKLDIKPIKVGLNLVAAFEKGEIFTPVVLDIDSDAVFADLIRAQRESFHLALGLAYPTKDTLPVLIGKAVREAKTVSMESNYVTSETAGDILAKAQRVAEAINQQTGVQ